MPPWRDARREPGELGATSPLLNALEWERERPWPPPPAEFLRGLEGEDDELEAARPGETAPPLLKGEMNWTPPWLWFWLPDMVPGTDAELCPASHEAGAAALSDERRRLAGRGIELLEGRGCRGDVAKTGAPPAVEANGLTKKDMEEELAPAGLLLVLEAKERKAESRETSQG